MKCDLSLQWLLFFILVLLLGEATGQNSGGRRSRTPRTKRSDKRALLAIRDALNLGIELESWNASTDPCRDGWEFVACDCDNFGPTYPIQQQLCGDFRPGRVSRVIHLGTGAAFNPEFIVSGTLPDALGRLTKLRWLDLSGNNLTGPIPNSFRNLTQLRYLSLSDNRLSGRLPGFFANYTRLRTLDLHSNNFKKELPPEWCENPMLFGGEHKNDTTFTIHNNPNLCGVGNATAAVHDCVWF